VSSPKDVKRDRLTSRLWILQRRGGHRAASDDTLLAWAAARACPGAVRILDLGSGKGTVAMLLLQRLPASRVIGLEALEESHHLALRNAQLNGLTDRWEPRLGDLRDPSALDGEGPFDLVTGAPPFMPLGSGVVPADPQRAAGRFEIRGGVREYALAAARHVSPDGRVVLLMDGREESRSRAGQAFLEAGLHVTAALAVHPLPGRAPTYRISAAGREPPARREESVCMRPADRAGFSGESEATRREMDATANTASAGRAPVSEPSI
jgi:tRNA1Val (adenine37-N6)-methyltransferase